MADPERLWLGCVAAALVVTAARAQGDWTTSGGSNWKPRWSSLLPQPKI